MDLSLLLDGLLIGIAAGGMGGVMAGLAGIGGGLIYVPIFYASMPNNAGGMASPVFASLVAVAMTGFFSARSHWRLDHVDTDALKRLLPGLLIGSGLGLWSTLQLPEIWVLMALAILDGWIAFDYGRSPRRRSGSIPLPLFSGPIGFISGALGIGGGTMLVPLLRRIAELRIAVGTSAACGAMMALGAVLLNTVFEQDWSQLLEPRIAWLIGAWLGILMMLPLATGWAARVHARVSEAVMRALLKMIFMLLALILTLAAISHGIQS